MKITVLYHPNSEYRMGVEDFVRDFKSRYSEADIEVLDVDSVDGSALAKLYDIVQYPAILVTDESGHLQQYWQGSDLPPIDEVAAYSRTPS